MLKPDLHFFIIGWTGRWSSVCLLGGVAFQY